MSLTNHTIARCACGSVEIDVTGEPILGAACFCDDCQEGARQLEALPGAAPVMAPDGGTDLLLYRKDRMHCSKGSDLLRDYRITDGSNPPKLSTSDLNSTPALRPV